MEGPSSFPGGEGGWEPVSCFRPFAHILLLPSFLSTRQFFLEAFPDLLSWGEVPLLPLSLCLMPLRTTYYLQFCRLFGKHLTPSPDFEPAAAGTISGYSQGLVECLAHSGYLKKIS